MLLKPYSILSEIEDTDPITQSHVGEVIDNKDPEKLGRVKVYIDMWDYMTTEEMPWVLPAGNSATGGNPNTAVHDIPEIGSQVRVSFPTGNSEDPRYDGVEPNATNKCSLFDEDYPYTHGNKDSIGNFIIHNKKTGISVFHHNSGTTVQLDKDGTFTITTPNGAYATCTSDNEWKFFGSEMTFVADDLIKLQASRIELDATTIETNADATTIESTNMTTITGGSNIKLGSPDVEIASRRTQIGGALSSEMGVSGTIMDMMSQSAYNFNNGLLTSIIKGGI